MTGGVERVIKVAFVCLGNICRSPMAELIFKSLVADENLSDKFFIDSFGTSDEEEGNGIYPPALRELEKHGIAGRHIAKKIAPKDIDMFDYILAADASNLARTLNISHGAAVGKVYRLCDFTDKPRDVIDPWYSRNFEMAYEDILDGCVGFLKYLKKNGDI